MWIFSPGNFYSYNIVSIVPQRSDVLQKVKIIPIRTGPRGALSTHVRLREREGVEFDNVTYSFKWSKPDIHVCDAFTTQQVALAR